MAGISSPSEFVTTARGIVGTDHIRPASPADVVDGVHAQWLVEPGTPAEVAAVLAAADAARFSVVPRGGGTKLTWGNPPSRADVILSTQRLNRILEHAAGDMTATVQAGCTVAAFAQHLAAGGHRLALDPLWPARATIGGILATHDSGALRATFGSLRDHLIGVTVALADGTLAKSGGKVVKNVAGYDLPKLMIGSFGTLGVIVEATFRLYPLARASQTLRFRTPSREIFPRALTALRQCAPLITALQFELTSSQTPEFLLLIEGLPASIEEKTSRVIAAATQGGLQQTNPPDNPWNSREALFEPHSACICKVALPPSYWPQFADTLVALPESWKLTGQALGIGLLQLPADAGLPALLAALRERLGTFEGTLTVLQCPTPLKPQIPVWPDPGTALRPMQRIKHAFDPHNTLSPGRFLV